MQIKLYSNPLSQKVWGAFLLGRGHFGAPPPIEIGLMIGQGCCIYTNAHPAELLGCTNVRLRSLGCANHTDTVSRVPARIPGYRDVALVVWDWDSPEDKPPVSIHYRCSISCWSLSWWKHGTRLWAHHRGSVVWCMCFQGKSSPVVLKKSLHPIINQVLSDRLYHQFSRKMLLFAP